MNYAQAGQAFRFCFRVAEAGAQTAPPTARLAVAGLANDNRIARSNLGVSDRDGVKSRTHRLHQSLAAPGPALPEQPLELGKRLLYGVEVR
jgi:hypothetical protein